MKKAFFLSLGLALVGCTTASTTMLADNIAVISARDMNTGSPSAVLKKALVTAAQTARARGFEYFGILAARDATSSHSDYLPGPISARNDYISGFGDFSVREIGSNLTVRFLHPNELPANRDGIYQASLILARQDS